MYFVSASSFERPRCEHVHLLAFLEAQGLRRKSHTNGTLCRLALLKLHIWFSATTETMNFMRM